MMGELFSVAAVRAHRPDIHSTVAIGSEINATLPPHRPFAGARIFRRQRLGLGIAATELPQILSCTALIPLRVAALGREPREEDRCARVLVTAIRGLGEGHWGGYPGDIGTANIERNELVIG